MAGAAAIAQGIERRRSIMRFIKSYTRREGFAPSLDEIAAAVDLRSKNAVRHHLDLLAKQGVLAVTPGKYRSLRIVNMTGRSVR
jgi:repressor LexA